MAAIAYLLHRYGVIKILRQSDKEKRHWKTRKSYRELPLSSSYSILGLAGMEGVGFYIEYSRKSYSYYYSTEGRFIQKLPGRDLSDDRMRGIAGGKIFFTNFFSRSLYKRGGQELCEMIGETA